MKAVILAAGKGTRMRDLTNEVPKPMLKINGKPILEHIITGILSAGIGDVFIVTGFRAEVIEDYFGNGSKWGAHLAYGRQLIQDGTGKAPELAKDFLGSSPFLLTYGDILVKPETYKQMLDRYRVGLFSGVITVTAGEDVTKGGLNFFDEEFCLKRLVEKPSAAQLEQLKAEGWIRPNQPVWYNAGIYIFKSSLFDYTAKLQKSSRGEYELTDAIIRMLETGHKFAGLEVPGRWVDVRDPEVLAALEKETPIEQCAALMNEKLALCPQCKNEVRFQESGTARICPNCGFAFHTSASPPRSYLTSEYSPANGVSLLGVVLRFFLVLGVIIVVIIGVLFVGCAVAFKL